MLFQFLFFNPKNKKILKGTPHTQRNCLLYKKTFASIEQKTSINTSLKLHYFSLFLHYFPLNIF